MTEESAITFFKITKCGYYKRGEGDPLFGEISYVLNEMADWTKGLNKPTDQTCTFEPAPESELQKTYCLDIEKHEEIGDFIIVTWNEIAPRDSNVPSANLKQPVGSSVVAESSTPPGFTPGYATYFWFVPSRNMYATIVFDNSKNGNMNLMKYFHGFLSKHTSAVVLDDESDDEYNVIGYALTGNDEPQALFPRFESHTMRNPAELKYIRENRENIRKIIRKNNLEYGVEADKSFILSALERLNIYRVKELNELVHFKYEIEFSPTEHELEKIISSWNKSHLSIWDDIGFKFKSTTDTKWLSHQKARTKLELDVRREGANLVKCESLMRALQGKRKYLISRLP